MIPTRHHTASPTMYRRPTLIIAAMALLSTQVGCPPPPELPAPTLRVARPPQVATVIVANQNLRHTAVMPGTVEGEETTDVYAKVGGFLAEINVDIGDAVTKGQTLAVLSIPEMAQELERLQAGAEIAQAVIAQSEAGVNQADAALHSSNAALAEANAGMAEKEAILKFRKAELQRTEELVASKALLAKKLDEARFTVEAAEAGVATIVARIRTAQADIVAAQANVEKAKTDLVSAVAKAKVADLDVKKTETMIEYGTLLAPFDGVVTKRMVDPGAFIKPADGNSAALPLVTISRINTVRLLVDLPMKEVRWLNAGDAVVFDRINVLPGVKIEGTITRYSAALNSMTRMLRVEIDLPNEDRQLRPGYFGYATILLAEFDGTPVIPASALITQDDRTYVFVVEGTTCHRREVSTNYRDGTIVGIESGIQAGDQVIRSGVGQLTDGQEVTPVTADSD